MPVKAEYHRKWRKANPDKCRQIEKNRAEKDPEANRKRNREKFAKWAAENPEKYKDQRFRYKYGISYDEYQSMFSQQGEACATCRAKDPGSRGWAVDHCHTTKKVRGILCVPCNLALGHVKDDPTVLQNMINYLGR